MSYDIDIQVESEMKFDPWSLEYDSTSDSYLISNYIDLKEVTKKNRLGKPTHGYEDSEEKAWHLSINVDGEPIYGGGGVVAWEGKVEFYFDTPEDPTEEWEKMMDAVCEAVANKAVDQRKEKIKEIRKIVSAVSTGLEDSRCGDCFTENLEYAIKEAIEVFGENDELITELREINESIENGESRLNAIVSKLKA